MKQTLVPIHEVCAQILSLPSNYDRPASSHTLMDDESLKYFRDIKFPSYSSSEIKIISEEIDKSNNIKDVLKNHSYNFPFSINFLNKLLSNHSKNPQKYTIAFVLNEFIAWYLREDDENTNGDETGMMLSHLLIALAVISDYDIQSVRNTIISAFTLLYTDSLTKLSWSVHITDRNIFLSPLYLFFEKKKVIPDYCYKMIPMTTDWMISDIGDDNNDNDNGYNSRDEENNIITFLTFASKLNMPEVYTQKMLVLTFSATFRRKDNIYSFFGSFFSKVSNNYGAALLAQIPNNLLDYIMQFPVINSLELPNEDAYFTKLPKADAFKACLCFNLTNPFQIQSEKTQTVNFPPQIELLTMIDQNLISRIYTLISAAVTSASHVQTILLNFAEILEENGKKKNEYIFDLYALFIFLTKLFPPDKIGQLPYNVLFNDTLFDPRITIFDNFPKYEILNTLRSNALSILISNNERTVENFLSHSMIYPKLFSETLHRFIANHQLLPSMPQSHVCMARCLMNAALFYKSFSAMKINDVEFASTSIFYIISHLFLDSSFLDTFFEDYSFTYSFLSFIFEPVVRPQVLCQLLAYFLKNQNNINSEVTENLIGIIDITCTSFPEEQSINLVSDVIDTINEALIHKRKLVDLFQPLFTILFRAMKFLSTSDLSKLLIDNSLQFFILASKTHTLTEQDLETIESSISSTYQHDSPSQKIFDKFIQLLSAENMSTLNPSFFVRQPMVIRTFLSLFSKSNKFIDALNFIRELCTFSEKNCIACCQSGIDIWLIEYIFANSIDPEINDSNIKYDLNKDESNQILNNNNNGSKDNKIIPVMNSCNVCNNTNNNNFKGNTFNNNNCNDINGNDNNCNDNNCNDNNCNDNNCNDINCSDINCNDNNCNNNNCNDNNCNDNNCNDINCNDNNCNNNNCNDNSYNNININNNKSGYNYTNNINNDSNSSIIISNNNFIDPALSLLEKILTITSSPNVCHKFISLLIPKGNYLANIQIHILDSLQKMIINANREPYAYFPIYNPVNINGLNASLINPSFCFVCWIYHDASASQYKPKLISFYEWPEKKVEVSLNSDQIRIDHQNEFFNSVGNFDQRIPSKQWIFLALKFVNNTEDENECNIFIRVNMKKWEKIKFPYLKFKPKSQIDFIIGDKDNLNIDKDIISNTRIASFGLFSTIDNNSVDFLFESGPTKPLKTSMPKSCIFFYQSQIINNYKNKKNNHNYFLKSLLPQTSSLENNININVNITNNNNNNNNDNENSINNNSQSFISTSNLNLSSNINSNTSLNIINANYSMTQEEPNDCLLSPICELFSQPCGICTLLPLFEFINDNRHIAESLISIIGNLFSLSLNNCQVEFAKMNGFGIISSILKSYNYQLYTCFYNLLDSISSEFLQRHLIDKILINFLLLFKCDSDTQLRIIRHWGRVLLPSFYAQVNQERSFSFIIKAYSCFYHLFGSLECKSALLSLYNGYPFDISTYLTLTFEILQSNASCLELLEFLHKQISFNTSSFPFNVELDHLFSLLEMNNEEINILLIKIIISAHENQLISKNCSLDEHIDIFLDHWPKKFTSISTLEILVDMLDSQKSVLPICFWLASIYINTEDKSSVLKFLKKLKPSKDYSISKAWCLWPLYFAQTMEMSDFKYSVIQFVINSESFGLMNIYEMICFIGNQCKENIDELKSIFLHLLFPAIETKDQATDFLKIVGRFLFFRSLEHFPFLLNEMLNSPFKDFTNTFIKKNFGPNKFKKSDFTLSSSLQVDYKDEKYFCLRMNDKKWIDQELAKNSLEIILEYDLRQFLQLDLLVCSFLIKIDLIYVNEHLKKLNFSEAELSENSFLLQYIRSKTFNTLQMISFSLILPLWQNPSKQSSQEGQLNEENMNISGEGTKINEENQFKTEQLQQIEKNENQEPNIDSINLFQEFVSSLTGSENSITEEMKSIITYFERVKSLSIQEKEFNFHFKKNFVSNIIKKERNDYFDRKRLYYSMSVNFAPWSHKIEHFPLQRENLLCSPTYSISKIFRKIKIEPNLSKFEIPKLILFESECELIKPCSIIQTRFLILDLELVINRKYIEYMQIKWILKRKYNNKTSAIELFLRTGKTYLINFPGQNSNFILNRLSELAHKTLVQIRTPVSFFNELKITEDWQNRHITNFEYIILLNIFSGRSFNDIEQYPMAPWILDNKLIIRDFKKSDYGVISRSDVLNFLSNIYPFSSENGSIPSMERMCNFELIPEFYSIPEFFNKNCKLPYWCNGSSIEFVYRMNKAIESEAVSKSIIHWFDAIWKSKSSENNEAKKIIKIRKNLSLSCCNESDISRNKGNKSSHLSDEDRKFNGFEKLFINQHPPRIQKAKKELQISRQIAAQLSRDNKSIPTIFANIRFENNLTYSIISINENGQISFNLINFSKASKNHFYTNLSIIPKSNQYSYTQNQLSLYNNIENDNNLKPQNNQKNCKPNKNNVFNSTSTLNQIVAPSQDLQRSQSSSFSRDALLNTNNLNIHNPRNGICSTIKDFNISQLSEFVSNNFSISGIHKVLVANGKPLHSHNISSAVFRNTERGESDDELIDMTSENAAVCVCSDDSLKMIGYSNSMVSLNNAQIPIFCGVPTCCTFNRSSQTAVCGTDEGYIVIFSLNRLSTTFVIKIAGANLTESKCGIKNKPIISLLMTKHWPFILVYVENEIILYNVNGEFIRKRSLENESITSWYSWCTSDGFDYIVITSDTSKVIVFEAFYLDFSELAFKISDSIAIHYIPSENGFVIVRKNGTALFVPFIHD